MASIGVIFASTYHTKLLNPWPNSSASHVVNYSWLSDCQGDMQPYEGDPDTRGRLRSLKQATAKAARPTFSINIWLNCYTMCTAIIYDEKCVLLLCAWMASFVKSGHIYIIYREFCSKFKLSIIGRVDILLISYMDTLSVLNLITCCSYFIYN